MIIHTTSVAELDLLQKVYPTLVELLGARGEIELVAPDGRRAMYDPLKAGHITVESTGSDVARVLSLVLGQFPFTMTDPLPDVERASLPTELVALIASEAGVLDPLEFFVCELQRWPLGPEAQLEVARIRGLLLNLQAAAAALPELDLGLPADLLLEP
jgi:hypothetical protein